MSHYYTNVNPYTLGKNRRAILGPPRMPNARDGSFTMAQQQVGLPYPRNQYQWSPGMGRLDTASDKLAMITASIAAAAGSVGAAINAPRLAKEQRKIFQYEQRRRMAGQQALVQAAKIAGAVVVGLIAVKALSVGVASIGRRRRNK